VKSDGIFKRYLTARGERRDDLNFLFFFSAISAVNHKFQFRFDRPFVWLAEALNPNVATLG
jgi:hypothetical protein